MITVISGTNRTDSMTLRVASHYQRLLAQSHPDVRLVSLEGRQVWERGTDMQALEAEYLIPAEKFVFVMPEYNGGMPGILKLMMDNSDIKKCWWYKKAALVGVADGRAGNLRGLDHMTNILNYMRMHVLYHKVPISRVNEEVSPDGQLLKATTAEDLAAQAAAFLQF